MTALVTNRKAFHDFEVIERFEVGISLFGHEVKAIREGKADFEGSYVKIVDGKPVILNLNISKFSKQGNTFDGEDPRRTRDLLLKKYEVERLAVKTNEKGLSLVPLKFFTDHGLIKLEIALVRGRKKHAVKEHLKIKQQEIDLKKSAKEEKKYVG